MFCTRVYGVMKGDIVYYYKQKTAYEMRIRDWSSDVCSSDLATLASCALTGPERRRDGSLRDRDGSLPHRVRGGGGVQGHLRRGRGRGGVRVVPHPAQGPGVRHRARVHAPRRRWRLPADGAPARQGGAPRHLLQQPVPLRRGRSEAHTSELQSLMRNSYAGFCLKKKK